ncbi:hypothetical protein [Corynebacterium neomassiliense]|uniref:hypothetical protein n=1 Tax=Corynebacterium neomassiliense TaxID=2079482 RepID=UPI0010315A75|nr:hypothetical protein [Corynebacterium neomassiliense]
MTKIGKRITVTIVASSLLVGCGAAHAQGVEKGSEKASVESVANKQSVNDKDLVMLLLTGTGSLADSHPNVVRDLGFSDDREKPTPEAAGDFADYFLAEHSDFHDDVAEPVISGDPRRVEEALKDVTSMSRATIDHVDSKVEQPQVSDYKWKGHVGLWHDAITAAEALANGVVYANVAVATMLVVAGAAAAVATVVLAYNFNSDKVSKFDREQQIAKLTQELKKMS